MFKVSNLYKTFGSGKKETHVLRGLNFSCEEGNFVGIFGASGSGKSTFLHVIGGLDDPTSGIVQFEGQNLFEKKEKDLADFRNRSIGFIFQFYHLLPEFSAVENVMLPCLIAGVSRHSARKLAMDALENVELKERCDHRSSELSGGEQQRVAIARAIIMKPKVILADEPTGNLDEETGLKVFAYLERLHKEMKMGIVMVTHNPELLKKMPKKMELKGGTLS